MNTLELIENFKQYKNKILNTNNECYLNNIGCCSEKNEIMYTEEERQIILGHSQDTIQEYFFFLCRYKSLDYNALLKKAHLGNELLEVFPYEVSYKEAIKLGIALKMNIDELLDLVGRIGMFISKDKEFDLVIRYSVDNKIYDIDIINELLTALELENL